MLMFLRKGNYYDARWSYFKAVENTNHAITLKLLNVFDATNMYSGYQECFFFFLVYSLKTFRSVNRIPNNTTPMTPTVDCQHAGAVCPQGMTFPPPQLDASSRCWRSMSPGGSCCFRYGGANETLGRMEKSLAFHKPRWPWESSSSSGKYIETETWWTFHFKVALPGCMFPLGSLMEDIMHM